MSLDPSFRRVLNPRSLCEFSGRHGRIQRRESDGEQRRDESFTNWRRLVQGAKRRDGGQGPRRTRWRLRRKERRRCKGEFARKTFYDVLMNIHGILVH